MSQWLQVATGVFLALAAAATSPADEPSTEIHGGVTARREGAVQVSFEPRSDVGPAVGDAATFTTSIEGIPVDAGGGEVVEVHAGSVWVSVSRGRPTLGNRAVIRATGRPTDRPARGAAVEPRPAPTPPPELGLVQHRIEGVGRLWLPRDLRPRPHEQNGPFWQLIAETSGRSRGLRRVDIKRTARIGDGTLDVDDPHLYAEALRLSRDERGNWTPSRPVMRRFENRRVRGPVECYCDSYDAIPPDRRKSLRLWGVTCLPDNPGMVDQFIFIGPLAASGADADTAVEWIVRSFEPES